jgi:hypothetical protein
LENPIENVTKLNEFSNSFESKSNKQETSSSNVNRNVSNTKCNLKINDIIFAKYDNNIYYPCIIKNIGKLLIAVEFVHQASPHLVNNYFLSSTFIKNYKMFLSQ